MIPIPRYTPLVTLLAVGFYFFLATRVARTRIKFNVGVPATSGHPNFDRIFRVHVNTLEWMPTFLIPLWLCAVYLSDATAAVLGLVWIAGRAWYFAGYSKSVQGRLPGFLVQSSACFSLFRRSCIARLSSSRRLARGAISERLPAASCSATLSCSCFPRGM